MTTAIDRDDGDDGDGRGVGDDGDYDVCTSRMLYVLLWICVVEENKFSYAVPYTSM